jgi:hypothetical protein
MFRVAAYAKEDVSQEYEAFKNAFSIHGEEEPEAPHSHSYTSSVTKAATCTTAGVRTYTCSCGHSYTASIPATGHKWNNGVVTVAPTEEKEGVRTYTCTLCGETYTETIAALDHKHNYASTVIAPTCTNQGYTEHTCPCGDSYKDTYVSATGHTYADGVCTVCGAADPNYVPEATLTGISATYSGGDVAEGTAVTDLTGIVVTAHYSDGSTETVTGYTLSGTIAEGSNTVTVSYGGKTATFTVTGIVEQASAWADGYFKTDGSIAQADTYMYYKEYLPFAPGQNCYIANTNPEWATDEAHFAWYDSDKNFLARTSSHIAATIKFDGALVYSHGTIPDNAAFVRGCAGNMTNYKDTAIISVEPPELYLPFEDAVWYADTYIIGSGATAVEAGCAASSPVTVEPGATYKFGNTNGSWSSNWFGIGFYRADGTFISRGSSAQFTTPSDAKYVRLSATGMTGYTETATLTKVS